MSGCAEASQNALQTSLKLLIQLEQCIPLPEVLNRALEALIQQSGSRFAFLLHNHSGTLISEFSGYNPENPIDKQHLQKHSADMLSCLIPQMRRVAPLIANSSTAVKTELSNTMAWRLFQRLILIPLNNALGDKKGILVLFGRADNYSQEQILGLEPLISLCINLLMLDEQKPEDERELVGSPTKTPPSDILTEYDYPFINSKDPRFITTAEGIIVQHNAAAESLLAFPSEKLTGQPLTRLIPKLQLSLHQKDPDHFQELKAFSKTGKLINVRISCSPFIQHSELLFSVQVQDIRAEIETKTERHERAFRIQKQQRATLEVARIATQEEAPFEYLIRDICQLASATLKTPRVGIWLSEEGTPVFRNVVQIDQNQADYCESAPLILNSNATFVR
ncbi:PAS domain S-box protein, partial [Oceanospirillum sp. HFRX-1_2]